MPSCGGPPRPPIIDVTSSGRPTPSPLPTTAPILYRPAPVVVSSPLATTPGSKVVAELFGLLQVVVGDARNGRRAGEGHDRRCATPSSVIPPENTREVSHAVDGLPRDPSRPQNPVDSDALAAAVDAHAEASASNHNPDDQDHRRGPAEAGRRRLSPQRSRQQHQGNPWHHVRDVNDRMCAPHPVQLHVARVSGVSRPAPSCAEVVMATREQDDSPTSKGCDYPRREASGASPRPTAPVQWCRGPARTPASARRGSPASTAAQYDAPQPPSIGAARRPR